MFLLKCVFLQCPKVKLNSFLSNEPRSNYCCLKELGLLSALDQQDMLTVAENIARRINVTLKVP